MILSPREKFLILTALRVTERQMNLNIVQHALQSREINDLQVEYIELVEKFNSRLEEKTT